MLAPIADAKRTLGSGDEAIHLFDLPPDSVRQIIIGARALPTLRDELRSIVATDQRLAHVELLEAVPDETAKAIRINAIAAK
jgi:hypothetical protein